MASAAYNFTLLNPSDLPTSDLAIDVWKIKNQDVILTQEYNRDIGLNWQFSKFRTELQTRFGQTIDITKQSFNQVLTLQNGKFSFVNFNSDKLFLYATFTTFSYFIFPNSRTGTILFG